MSTVGTSTRETKVARVGRMSKANFQCLLTLENDDAKDLSQIWAVAPALVKLALRDDRRNQTAKEPP